MVEQENRERMYWMQKFSEENLISGQTENRYACVDRISKAIKAKKGWYSSRERVMWMTFLYACLIAPNYCFTKNADWREKKKAIKCAVELNDFASRLEFEIVCSSSIYTYLDCVRDYLKKLPYKIADPHPMAGDLHKALMAMLKKRKRKYPELQVTPEEYKQTLDKIFKEEAGRLNHPVFFLFLPYYLFIELAKCEKLISAGTSKAKVDGSDRINAFIIPELHADTLNWTIRTSPLQIENDDAGADHIKRLLNLYKKIERTLCKQLLKQDYHSIGEATQKAIWVYPKDPLMAQFFSFSSIKKMDPIEPHELNEENELVELERLSEQEQFDELKELLGDAARTLRSGRVHQAHRDRGEDRQPAPPE